jgi:hypothetical protein
MPQPAYSPDISPCNFRLFGLLKQILRDREFAPSDEIKDTIAQIWNDLAFDNIRSLFRDWIRRLSCVAKNDGEYISE